MFGINKKITLKHLKIPKWPRFCLKPIEKWLVKNKKFIALLGILPLLVVLVFGAYILYFAEKIYPGVLIADTDVSGKTPEQAIELLKGKIVSPEEITLIKDDRSFKINLKDLDFAYDFASSVEKAYLLDRTENLLTNVYQKIFTIKRHVNLPLSYKINQEKLAVEINRIAEEVALEPIYPSAKISQGEVVIQKGQKGEEVNREKLLKDIDNVIAYSNIKPLIINTNFIDVTLSDEQALIYKERAIKLLAKRVLISFEDTEISYSKDDLLEFLEPKGGYKESQIASAIKNVATKINRPAQNPTFVFVSQSDTSRKVQEFTPPKDGIEIKTEELKTKILNALATLENQDDKQVNITPNIISTAPEYQTGDVNNLGIKELLGRGKSRFSGSIASRIHNVALASSKFNGILIKPGDTFSFNQTLGDVSANTGYQQAYIIKEGATILGDGGGVCQVSTTFFRAVLNAGLPVIERRAHAYRVSYYEQDSPPGLDATVYDPSPDFKFKNDTPAHILIQTKVDTKAKTLVFEIYGTSDGRIATTTKPVIKESTPPPEDLYIDDPTLPAGQVKQIDWKAWGAKVSFKYTVTNNGETVYEKTFNSTYQPWQAKFLRGTGPIN